MHWCMNRVFILAHVYHSLNKVVYGNTTFIFLNWIISFLVKADTQTIYWKRFKMYARHVNILSHFGTNLHMMDSDTRNWCIFFLLDAQITNIFAIRCHIMVWMNFILRCKVPSKTFKLPIDVNEHFFSTPDKI